MRLFPGLDQALGGGIHGAAYAGACQASQNIGADLLAQFDSLTQLDTAGVPPTSHAVPVTARLRDDVVKPSLPRQEVLALTEHVDDQLGGFIVPQVLPGDGGGA